MTRSRPFDVSCAPYECCLGVPGYYFNDMKPLTCSLCTAPVCVECSKVFRWGDQFQRKVCSCGGTVEVRRMSDLAPRLECRCRHCGHAYGSNAACKHCHTSSMFDAYRNGWVNDREIDSGDVSTFDVRGPVPRRVFIKAFKYRCSCCCYLQALEGLEYFSYEEPTQDEKDSYHLLRGGGSGRKGIYGQAMYFPNARCERCIDETGKVIARCQLVPMKKRRIPLRRQSKGRRKFGTR